MGHLCGTSWRMLVLLVFLNQDCCLLVSKRIPATTTCYIVECYIWNKYSGSRHHMLRIVACYIAIWTTCGPVQCWHCKTITMALAMAMALRETDITAKNLCDAETSPWTDYRSALLKPKAHTEWKPLDFASDDLLGFNLIFWLLDCLIKEPAILSPMHISGVSVPPWK